MPLAVVSYVSVFTLMKPRSVSCTPASLRPMSSTLGARPAATSTRSTSSSFFSPPTSAVIFTEPFATLTFEILAPVRISMPRFLNERATAAELSASSSGRIAGMTSTIVTFVPYALNTSANSHPTAPAPTTIIVLGAPLER